MRDTLAKQDAWPGTPSNNETNDGTPPRHSLAELARAALPDACKPAVRRSLLTMRGRLPAVWRARLDRVLAETDPDRGLIERDYQAWIDAYDSIDSRRRAQIAARIGAMSAPPTISVVMPVYNPAPRHLRAAIASVRAQLYPYWELCIADDASTDPNVARVLREAMTRDSRIHTIWRATNGNISEASNAALRIATGGFVALLDHDDLLAEHALYEVAERIAARPDSDIVYSDEDHIDDTGRRSHPYFKPDWDPALMLGQNMASHFGVYRRESVERVGGFRAGLEGSQDYDLTLRVSAISRPERIQHIAKVLYHWRQRAGGPTFSESRQDACVLAARRAVADYLSAGETGARIVPARDAPGFSRVVHALPENPPLVSVVVTSHTASRPDAWRDRTNYPALETVGTAGRASGALLLFLDPDLIPAEPDWLREMVSQVVRPGVGAAGARLLSARGRIAHAGFALDAHGNLLTPFAGAGARRAGYAGHLQLARSVMAVSGACLLVRRAAFEQARSPEPSTGRGDIALCLGLAREGWRTVWTPYATLGFRSGTPPGLTPDRVPPPGSAAVDPYWSPNLTVADGVIRLAVPA